MQNKRIIPIYFFGIYAKHLAEWSEGRICRNTIAYIEGTEREFSIGYAYHVGNHPVAISVASKHFCYAAVATHPDYRGRGLARKVLERTINHFKMSNFIYKTWVAQDNEASVRLFNRCGLHQVDGKIKSRSDGDYMAFKFSSRKKSLTSDEIVVT